MAILPLALADHGSSHSHTGGPSHTGYPEPAYQRPSYGSPHGASYHSSLPPRHHPKPTRYGYQKPSYGYEYPKHNCTIEDVVERIEVCTPTFETNCEDVELDVKTITDGEYCYDHSQTLCSEAEEETEFEVCTYGYKTKHEEATAKTAEVSFHKEVKVEKVTVCEPPKHDYGYHETYGPYCKDVEQETSYNVPHVYSKNVTVHVALPDPVRTCHTKSLKIPKLTCEVKIEEKCVSQPEVQDSTVTVEKCNTTLGKPECHKVELTLPKQVCRELVFGYAHEETHKEPKHVHHH